MTHFPRSGKHLLVVSNDIDRGLQMARVLSALGYETAVSSPASVSLHCCQEPPDAAVVAAGEEGAAIQDGLREVKRLQQQGTLPPFPLIALGDPTGTAVVHLIDGIVLEPGRLTSLAVEVSKQVDGELRLAPAAVDDDEV